MSKKFSINEILGTIFGLLSILIAILLYIFNQKTIQILFIIGIIIIIGTIYYLNLYLFIKKTKPQIIIWSIIFVAVILSSISNFSLGTNINNLENEYNILEENSIGIDKYNDLKENSIDISEYDKLKEEFNSSDNILRQKLEELKEIVMIRPLHPLFDGDDLFTSKYVRDLAPDEQHYKPGNEFQMGWLLRNTGNIKWSTKNNVRAVKIQVEESSNFGKNILSVNPTKPQGDVEIWTGNIKVPDEKGEHILKYQLKCDKGEFGTEFYTTIYVD
jgi:hypothetical protein